MLSILYFAHVLFGEPASTSPEHALAQLDRASDFESEGREFDRTGRAGSRRRAQCTCVMRVRG
jgi:hypothetical protein